MKPEFSFIANSTKPDDQSGVATWRYTTKQRGEWVGHILRQRFDTFAEAFEIDALVHLAWDAGFLAGCERVGHVVRTALDGAP